MKTESLFRKVGARAGSVLAPGFLQSFFALYLFLVLQNVITLSVNLADNIMLGGYQEVSLSGVAAVNQIQFIYQQLLAALGDALVMFLSQYWGKKEKGPMRCLVATALRTGLLLGTGLFLVTGLFPEEILHLFTEDRAIIGEGARYLSIVRSTYLFFALTQILLAMLRSMGQVAIAFALSVQTLLVNASLNYCLIYGHLGAPRLGVRGAAIGTLLARMLEFAILLGYLALRERSLRFRLRDLLLSNGLLRKDYFRAAAPMMLVQGLWGLNTALQTVILGHMTSAAIAANSAASALFLVVKSISVGASGTASILIGQKIGEGDLREAGAMAVRLQKVFLILGLFSGGLLLLLRGPVLSLYSLSEEASRMAAHFLLILSVVAVGVSYQMPVNNGIIRGGGSPMFVVKMDLISIWGIVIPLSLFMAFVAGASPEVVVCCLNADQIFKCVPAYLKCNHGSWIRILTRSETGTLPEKDPEKA